MAKLISKVVAFILIASACQANVSAAEKLTYDQSQAFRSWFVRIIKEQIAKGPSPRWTQKDCSSLIRFAAYEALRQHDKKWLRSSGTENQQLPPEVALTKKQEQLLNNWNTLDGKNKSSFVTAIGLAQENANFISKDINQARPGDLLFFDQGEDQHLMVWMGSYVAYHTGSHSKKDSGLRSVTLEQLMNWKDSRWQPKMENPNYIGVYRLAFLSY